MLPGPVTRSTGSHVPGAVGEHRDRLGAAGGVDLVDAEQRARGEDRGVRQAAVVLLRRARHGERRHAGDLGRHDVHDHRARVDRASAGHVEADAVDGQPALGDRAAGHDLGGVSVRRWSSCTSRARRIDSSSAARTVGVERRERGVERLLRHAQARRAYAVEPLAPLEHGLGRRGRGRPRRSGARLRARSRHRRPRGAARHEGRRATRGGRGGGSRRPV